MALKWGLVSVTRAFRFKKRLNFSIDPRKILVFYRYFSNRSEAQTVILLMPQITARVICSRTTAVGGKNGQNKAETGESW
mgnify:CR=1 FL=1